jgi:hypothetical protein
MFFGGPLYFCILLLREALSNAQATIFQWSGSYFPMPRQPLSNAWELLSNAPQALSNGEYGQKPPYEGQILPGNFWGVFGDRPVKRK